MKNIPAIILGKDEHGKNVSIDIETLIKTRLLIQANSGGGKSYLIRRMCEQMFGHVPVIIIDPEGEFATLREKFGYVLVGKGGETPADPRSAKLVAHKLLELRASAVIDLYEMNPAQRHLYVKLFCEAMIDAPKTLWRSTMFVIDEAHTFAPEKGAGESEASDAVTAFSTRGRKRQFCVVFATQRLGKLRKDASAELLNRLVGPTFEDVDLKRAADLLSIPGDQRREFDSQMRVLEPGNFYALGRAICKERTLFKVGPVQTSHEITQAKFGSEPPPAPDQIKKLLPQLADLPKQAEEAAKTETELRAEVRQLKSQVKLLEAAPRQVAAAKPEIKEVSVLTAEDRKLLKGFQDSCSKLQIKFEDLIQSKIGSVTALFSRIEKSTSRPLTAPAPVPKKVAPTYDRARVLQPTPVVESNGEFKPSKAQRKVLTVLNQFPEGCTINKIALLACYKVSGGFMSELSTLRTTGCIVGGNTEIMRITEHGQQFAENIPLPPPGDDRIDYFLRHPAFSKAQRQVITALRGHTGMTIDELADATGYKVSGGYMSELSGLRTSGIMLGKNTERMKLNPEMLE